ncbi:MAG: RNA-guided endonuclease InsQ/TnpB family protein [Candidatus Wukongarchaeota archaeon]|nr:transposase [Candidatus Wukongarchaeota archaeon]
MKTMISYKFRLYPDKKQEEKMFEVLDRCRFVYNKMLEGLNKQDKPNRFELQNSLPELKEKYLELKKVYSKVLQYESYRLFSNLRSLAGLKKNGKKVGRLRFKGKGWFKTFTYNQSGFKIIETSKRHDLLHLSKIGDIKIRIHRKVEGKIKQVTVKRYSSGRWYAFLCYEQIIPDKKEVEKVVGIDVGIIRYVTDTDGRQIEHPLYLNNSLKSLRRNQRKLSKKKKGSNNYNKQKIKVAKMYEKVKNQRDDFLQKLSRFYADNYDFIAVEKLNIKGLIRISYNARNVMDSSWRKFAQFLSYKAERAGKTVVEVNPRGTTQECYKCGKEVKKSLAVRIHKCPYCGLEIERDYNSSFVVLKRGLEELLGQGLSEFTPVEIEPLPREISASSVVEAGSFLR